MNSDLLIIGKKALHKEAAALHKFVDQLDSRFEKACEILIQCKGAALMTGMGKSGLVARKWASTMTSTGTKAYFLNPAEAQHGDLGIMHAEDVLVALSFRGETTELEPIVRHAEELDIPIIGITANEQSTLARLASVVVPIEVSEEACPLNLAPTTSSTLMMALGDAIAVTLMQMRGFTERDFAKLHPGGSLGRRLWLQARDLMHTGEQIPTVLPDTAFNDVLIEMTRKRLGMTVVVDQGRQVLGIITDGDLRRYFQKGIVQGTAIDIMTSKPKTISQTVPALEARDRMERESIHHLIIVGVQGELQGVLHLDDLVKAKLV